MRSSSLRRGAAALATTVLLGAGLVACGDDADTTSADGASEVILLIPSPANDYIAVVTETIEAEAKKAGIDLQTKTTDFDAAEQAQQVNQAISQKPDAIVIWPADSTAVVAPLAKIKAADIPLVVIDSEPVDEKAADSWTSFSGYDDNVFGQQAAQAMVDELTARGESLEGQVAAITGVPGTPPAIKRLDAFKSALGEIAPDLEITFEQSSSNWDQQSASSIAASIFTQIPAGELKGFFGAFDPFNAAVVVAAERAGVDPASFVSVGVGCTAEGKRNIESGAQFGSVLQSPEVQGIEAVGLVQDILEGRAVEKRTYLPTHVITADLLGDCA